MAATTNRGTATPVLVEPAAAAQHPIGPVHLRVVDVPAPVPDVAQHVVEAPRVRRLATHLVDPVTGVGSIPGDIIEGSVTRSGHPSPARVLPLSLGRQPEPVRRLVPLSVLASYEVCRGEPRAF